MADPRGRRHLSGQRAVDCHSDIRELCHATPGRIVCTAVRGRRKLAPALSIPARPKRRPISTRMEELICATDLDWTIIRTGFLSNIQEPKYRVAVGRLPEAPKTLPRAGLAELMLRAARAHTHSRQSVGLCAYLSVSAPSNRLSPDVNGHARKRLGARRRRFRAVTNLVPKP